MLETHIQVDKGSSILKSLDYEEHCIMEGRGFARGLWIGWKPYHFKLEMLEKHDQFVHFRVTKDDVREWRLSVVYASPSLQKKKD